MRLKCASDKANFEYIAGVIGQTNGLIDAVVKMYFKLSIFRCCTNFVELQVTVRVMFLVVNIVSFLHDLKPVVFCAEYLLQVLSSSIPLLVTFALYMIMRILNSFLFSEKIILVLLTLNIFV